jgi:LAO/AO transport system kinase
VWNTVTAFRKALTDSGELTVLRAQQARAWMWAETAELLIAGLKNHDVVKSLVPTLEAAVLKGELPATVAAQRLIDHYKADV